VKTTKVYFSRRDACLLAIFAMTLVFALWFTVDGVYALSWIFAAAGLGIYLVLSRAKPMLIQEDEKPIEGATPAVASPSDLIRGEVG
jgi:hypothetical protein